MPIVTAHADDPPRIANEDLVRRFVEQAEQELEKIDQMIGASKRITERPPAAADPAREPPKGWAGRGERFVPRA